MGTDSQRVKSLELFWSETFASFRYRLILSGDVRVTDCWQCSRLDRGLKFGFAASDLQQSLSDIGSLLGVQIDPAAVACSRSELRAFWLGSDE